MKICFRRMQGELFEKSSPCTPSKKHSHKTHKGLLLVHKQTVTPINDLFYTVGEGFPIDGNSSNLEPSSGRRGAPRNVAEQGGARGILELHSPQNECYVFVHAVSFRLVLLATSLPEGGF